MNTNILGVLVPVAIQVGMHSMVGYRVEKDALSRLLLIIFLLAFMPAANAAHVIADSVSENSAPPIVTNPSCNADVSVTSNGSTAGDDGYCIQSSVSSTYEITYHFNKTIHEKMSSIIIWANAGSKYADGELRSFDLEVDYKNSDGSSATLVMSGVYIGDTINVNDPKTVTFIDNGSAVDLLAVSEVRISNLGGAGSEYPFRELQGEVEYTGTGLSTKLSLVRPTTITPTIGNIVEFHIDITNNYSKRINGISLVSLLPPGLTLIDFTKPPNRTPTVNYDAATGALTGVQIPELGSKFGHVRTLILRATVDSDQAGNTITMTTTSGDTVNDDAGAPDDVNDLNHIMTIAVPDPKLSVVKTAAPQTNVAAGATVIYTYVVTNTGNQPISNVSLSEALADHTGSGSVPVPTNESLTSDDEYQGDSSNGTAADGVWDLLGIGDQVTFTGTYLVTQNDVDTLQ